MLTSATKLTIEMELICSHVLFFLLLFLRQSLALSFSFPKEALPTKSGYLSVNPDSSSAMFYTFYEAQNSTLPLSRTPILIWLQGGPGCSSMAGNFFELGPYRIVDSSSQNAQNLTLEPNQGSWNRIFGLLFLDNPIGVGFSVAAKKEEIPRDEPSVAKHLFAAITGFIDSNPEFKNRPIYVTGESYAGKYVPSIGYYILQKNMKLPLSKQVNLKGVAIGNGLTDPVTQLRTLATMAYFSSWINERQKQELEKIQEKAIKLAEMGKLSKAADARNEAYDRLKNMTGLATLFDNRKKVPYKTKRIINRFLQSAEVKKELGANVSTVFRYCNKAVKAILHEDVMKSVKPEVEFLVKKSKVLLYQGHNDMQETAVSTEAWVKTMKWEGIERFLMAERKVWKVREKLAGYVQKWGSLSHVVILGAGHMAPADQPINSQSMIEDWVLERGLFGSLLNTKISEKIINYY